MAEREGGRYLSPKQKAQLYKKAARLCSQLREAVQEAARARYRESWAANPAAIIPEEMTQTLLCRLLGEDGEFDPRKHRKGLLRYGDVVDLLSSLQSTWERDAEPFFWSTPLMYSFSGRRDPSVVYCQYILFLWTDTFGGRLTISRDPQDARNVYGPLVRYFFSVAKPVMGRQTPSLQSLPDIVDRQKDFYHWRSAYNRLRDSNKDEVEQWADYIREVEQWADYIREIHPDYIRKFHPDLARWSKKLI
jgi:hypothetical protein